MAYEKCLYCGEDRDTSNRFTSPANAEKDYAEWIVLHAGGKCVEVQYLEALEAEKKSEQELDELERKALAAWEEHSIGFAFSTALQHYSEKRMFVEGYLEGYREAAKPREQLQTGLTQT